MMVFHFFGILDGHALCDTVGRLRATNLFPLARRQYFETIQEVFENLFLDFVTCFWICLSIRATCVCKGCILAARLTLYCVCVREDFMSYDIALFLNILEVLSNILVLLVVVLWESCRHHFTSVWRLKNLFDQTFYQ